MPTAYMLLINGFEEIEALTPLDILRRGNVTVHTVGLSGAGVTGSHGITVQADIPADAAFSLPPDADMLILPGGPGVQALKANPVALHVLQQAAQRKLALAAICAAPTLLCQQGLLAGKTVTAFPDCRAELQGCHYTGSAVEVDGNIITARSAGVALPFAHALLEYLQGTQIAEKVLAGIYPQTAANNPEGTV